MFCPHCGSQLEGTPKFCGVCGHKIPSGSSGGSKLTFSPSGGSFNGFSQGEELNSNSGSYSDMSGSGAYSSSDQYGASGSSGSSASSYDYGDNSNYNSGGYGAEAPGSYSGDSGYGSDGYGAGGYSSGGYGSDGYSSDGYGSDGYNSNGYGSDGYGTGGSVPTSPPVTPGYNPGSDNGSYFDGTGGEIFVKLILFSLLTVVTCSLATPWILVDILRWRKRHTVINGKRLDFDGTAGELFGLWIKWLLLSVVTCGIYSYWVRKDYLDWEKSHTFYEGQAPYSSTGERISYFDGSLFELVGVSHLAQLLKAVTCGIGGAWGDNWANEVEFKGTCICGDRFFYTGTGGAIFGLYIKNVLLTGITCGVYAPWAMCAVYRYFYSNVHYDPKKSGH